MNRQITEAIFRDLVDPLKVGEVVRVTAWNTIGSIVNLSTRNGRRFARVRMTGFYTEEFLVENLERWPYDK